ncbi:MAG TPA: YjbQ family protein [Anaerolineales bacterium]|nr:YjbQ family protein [Anaerolineales bacterium]
MIANEIIHVTTANRVTFEDITEAVQKAVTAAGIKNGTAFIFTPHTTCSVFIQENSDDVNYWGNEYLMQDLLNVFEKVVPTCTSEGQYLFPGPKHVVEATKRGEKPCWTLNTDGHLRSILVGQSSFVPVIDSELFLGAFGRVFFADFDQVRARDRKIVVQVNGE